MGRTLYLAVLIFGFALVASGCLSRPPDTPLHVRPTDGKPRAPGEKKGGLYDSIELKPGGRGGSSWSVAEGSYLRITLGVDERFTAFGHAPFVRSILRRQGLTAFEGRVPLEGRVQIDRNRIDTADGSFVLRLDQLDLDDSSRVEAVQDLLFGIPEHRDGRVEARITEMKFGSGPREGFAIQGDMTVEIDISGSPRPMTVFMTLARVGDDRYRWTTYQPIEVKVDEGLLWKETVIEVADAWNARKIGDIVRIHADLVLERRPGT